MKRIVVGLLLISSWALVAMEEGVTKAPPPIHAGPPGVLAMSLPSLSDSNILLTQPSLAMQTALAYSETDFEPSTLAAYMQFLQKHAALLKQKKYHELLIMGAAAGVAPRLIDELLNTDQSLNLNYKTSEKCSMHSGSTAAHVATRMGHIFFLRKLYERGASFNLFDDRGEQPIHVAVRKRPDIVELLLPLIPSIDAPDQKGQTPLLIAAWQGDQGTVELLLTKKANPNQADNRGRTPLMGAVLGSFTAVIKRLLTGGALVDAQDQEGRTALFYAVRAGYTPSFEMLLAYNPNIAHQTLDDETIFAYAAHLGRPKMTAMLLKRAGNQARALLDQQDWFGRTPAMNAALTLASDKSIALYKTADDATVKDRSGKTSDEIRRLCIDKDK